MKITDITTYLVPPRWAFVKIQTDDAALYGWGEPILEGKAATVVAAVEELKDMLRGENPLETEYLWQKMYRGNFYRGGPVLMSAISGIDQALWDIKGKYYGAPVYSLLGGPCRKKIRVYSWIGGDIPHSPEETARQAKTAQDNGFTAIKMNASAQLEYIDVHHKVDAIIARVDAVRTAVGNTFDIAVDFHGRVHKAMAAILLRELMPYNLLFVEEPVLPEHLHALPSITRGSTIPIATGERLFSRYDFRSILEDGSVHVVQPDISHAGGISECVRIASMAETYDVHLALHCPLGPIALTAALHVDAVAYNMLIQEQSMGIHYNKESGAEVLDYLNNKDVLSIKDGYIPIPTERGLGLDIDEDMVKRASQHAHAWRNPIWNSADGAIAEW